MELGNVTAQNIGVRGYNYEESLKQIQLFLPNITCRQAEEVKRMPCASNNLFSLTKTQMYDGRLCPDRYSTSLLHGYIGYHGFVYTAAQTPADGSCLFYAASLLICGKLFNCKLV